MKINLKLIISPIKKIDMYINLKLENNFIAISINIRHIKLLTLFNFR